jgi:hypothetical protein
LPKLVLLTGQKKKEAKPFLKLSELEIQADSKNVIIE